MKNILLLLLFLFIILCNASLGKVTMISSVEAKRKDEIVSITLKKIEVSLPVKRAIRENNVWPITDDVAAFFGEGSANPGQPGSTVIFGHAKVGVFDLLPLINVGDSVTLTSKTKIYNYTVSERQFIGADDIASLLLNDKSSHRLMIFTCAGDKDQYRLLVQATPTKN